MTQSLGSVSSQTFVNRNNSQNNNNPQRNDVNFQYLRNCKGRSDYSFNKENNSENLLSQNTEILKQNEIVFKQNETLLERLEEFSIENERLREEIERLRRRNEFLLKKFEGLPGDVFCNNNSNNDTEYENNRTPLGSFNDSERSISPGPVQDFRDYMIEELEKKVYNLSVKNKNISISYNEFLGKFQKLSSEYNTLLGKNNALSDFLYNFQKMQKEESDRLIEQNNELNTINSILVTRISVLEDKEKESETEKMQLKREIERLNNLIKLYKSKEASPQIQNSINEH